MMNNREKIKVEYYTVDGKTHNFEASLVKTSTEESKDDQESKNTDANNK